MVAPWLDSEHEERQKRRSGYRPTNNWFLCGGVLVTVDVHSRCWRRLSCRVDAALGHGAHGLDLRVLVLHGFACVVGWAVVDQGDWFKVRVLVKMMLVEEDEWRKKKKLY